MVGARDPDFGRVFTSVPHAGVLGGAALIFFAYIGFDAVSTTAEEAKDPQRDLPRAMIWSLVITSIIYIVVTLVLTGILPWREHATADPLAAAFQARGFHWAAGIIAFGAVAIVFADSGVLTAVLTVPQMVAMVAISWYEYGKD